MLSHFVKVKYVGQANALVDPNYLISFVNEFLLFYCISRDTTADSFLTILNYLDSQIHLIKTTKTIKSNHLILIVLKKKVVSF